MSEQMRMMEVGEDEQAIIRVRTKHHISLVFGKTTLTLFEKDGVVYTRQEVTDADGLSDDGDRYEDVLADGDADTQTMDEFQRAYDLVCNDIVSIADLVGLYDEPLYMRGCEPPTDDDDSSVHTELELDWDFDEGQRQRPIVVRDSLDYLEAGDTQIEIYDD
ncbi:hypothetical protein EBT25_04985 [bacterium]|jgi:hypothetical protein|nr:hypothetical protein [bacterium]